MHIVIGYSMTKEQCTMQVIDSLYRIHLVAILIFLRSTHITLRIDGIVESPTGRRSHSHTSLEDWTTFAHAHQSIETTEAPSPNADIVLIHIWQSAHIDGCLHLVLRLQVAKTQVSTFLEVGTTTACTTTIHTYHDESFLGQVVVEGTALSHTARIPSVEHLLVARSGVLEEDNRIFLVGIEVKRLHHPTIQFDTFGSSESKSLTLAPIVLLGFLQQLLVIFQGLDYLSLAIANGKYLWMTIGTPCIDKIAIVAREISRVGTFLIG